MINNIAIVGGMHGNEVTGLHLVEHWANASDAITRPSFATHLFIGNPKAARLNRRYVDEDLNRCFAAAVLESDEKVTYESNRAFYLNQVIGPKGRPKHDFLIDMHTSTSNCGVMIIIIEPTSLNLSVAAYIMEKEPKARIHYIPSTSGDLPYMNSIAPNSLGIEVGPIPQGLIRSDSYHLTARVIGHSLDYLHHVNCGSPPIAPGSVEVYRLQEVVRYPEKNGLITGFIHSSLQDADYQQLNPGDPLFELFDGAIIPYRGDRPVYPVFINEAAYYDTRIAMSLCVKQQMPVRPSA